MSDTYEQPAPVPSGPPPGERQELPIPKERQEFVYEGSVEGLPEWIDPGWAGNKNGMPALHVPQGSPDMEGPYTTTTAVPGDTILFIPAKGATPSHYEIVPASKSDEPEDVAPEPTREEQSKKPVQASGASLEDLIRSGALKIEEMTPEQKGQVAARSPRLARMHGLDDPEVVRAKPSA